MSPSASTPRPFVVSGDDVNDFLRSFWQRQIDAAEQEVPDYRHPALPLARIKKVMKSDPEVKQMIAADAPILFCKACEIFISEITSRAFLQADSSKRRTLSRQDIVRAVQKSDQFDFLIDILPRDEALAADAKKKASAAAAAAAGQPAAEQAKQTVGPGVPGAVDASRAGASGPTDVLPAAMTLDQLQSLMQQPARGGPAPR